MLTPTSKTPSTLKGDADEKASVLGQEPEENSTAEPALEEETPPVAEVMPFGKTSGPAKNADTKGEIDKAVSAAKADVAEKQYRFISTYPRLTLYIYAGLQERVDGQLRPAPSKVQFKNGGYFTSSKEVGEALLAHPKCNSQLFRHVAGADAAARMVVASQAEETMRTPTFSGATSSGDGNEQEFLQRQRLLEEQKNLAFHG